MFGFEYGIVHISNDDAYNDNSNVTKSIYSNFQLEGLAMVDQLSTDSRSSIIVCPKPCKTICSC